MATARRTATIDDRFCGPPGSGNGGYTCGLLAGALDGAPAVEVTLQLPPPLGRPLEVEVDGPTAVLRDGADVVARATVASLELDPPVAPAPAEVERAGQDLDLARYAAEHPFPRCFTCGPGRAEDDGLRIFPGPTGRDALVVWPWTPSPSTADGDAVALPIVWAALDCPSGQAWISSDGGPGAAVLGRMAASVRRRPVPGEALVAGGWQVAAEGRKLQSGSAVWTADGEVVALAATTWIVLTAEQLAAFGAAR